MVSIILPLKQNKIGIYQRKELTLIFHKVLRLEKIYGKRIHVTITLERMKE